MLRPIPPALRALSASRPSLQLRFFSAASAADTPAASSQANILSATSTSTSTPTEPLPYTVGRSASLNLPVYHRIKSGGTNKTTEVKKIEGDGRVLAQQLREALNVETKTNPRTNHVIIKGFHKDKIVAWLEERGF